LVRAPYRLVPCDYHAFGAFTAHMSFILHATFSRYCGALRLVGVVPSCHISLKGRRNSSHGFSPTLLPSRLQKCIFGHKWHWYAFCIERSHATITYLVHSLPIPASSYRPHSLAIALHCVSLELFPHFLNPWNEGGTTPT